MTEESEKGGTFKRIWNSVMCLIYVGIAYLILFTPLLVPRNFRANDPDTDDFFIPRIILGVGVAVYALFRGYRVWKNKK